MVRTYGLIVGASDFASVAVLIIVAFALSGLMLVLTHLAGPRRHGPVKDSPYESGMTPLSDARRRFNVRFYLVAVMYVVFSVEVVFLYPWAVVFPRERAGLSEMAATSGTPATVSETARWAHGLAQNEYGPGFMLAAILIFFALLAVGFVYEWRKGIFQWD